MEIEPAFNLSNAMSKSVMVLFLAVAVGLAAYFGFRSARISQAHRADAARIAELAAEIETIRLVEKEALRRAEADAEARRMAEIGKMRVAEAEARRLAEVETLRKREQAARRRAEEDAAQAALALAMMTEEKSAFEAEARRLSDLRLKEAREAEERFRKAQRALDASDEALRANQAELDRQQALLDSLHHQNQAESIADFSTGRASRFIYPVDYKRGNHYRILITD